MTVRKRGPYQRRFHIPLFPIMNKTTTPEGRTEYGKLYMRKLRATQPRAEQRKRRIQK